MRVNRSTFAKLALTVLGAAGLVAPAAAHKIVHVKDKLYVIVCDSGAAFTYSGSQSGAGEVAGLMCPKKSSSGSKDRVASPAGTKKPDEEVAVIVAQPVPQEVLQRVGATEAADNYDLQKNKGVGR